MAIQVDVWGGELHQSHIGCLKTDDWQEAFTFIETQVEGGMLCNVLHTDFKAPPERVAEAEIALAATLNQPKG